MAFIAFPQPIIEAEFIKRYKRFLADFRLSDGSVVTAHCANTGSMLGCLEPGAPALLWDAGISQRVTRYSWKAIRIGKVWVGIDTQLPNRLVEAAIAGCEIASLADYAGIRREVRMGADSRVDLLLQSDWLPDCYVEVKNVTLVNKGVARFPDAVTVRGRKHLEELQRVVAGGSRAAMVFLVQRADAGIFMPADDIDPAYGAALRQACKQGVEIYVLSSRVERRGVHSVGLLDFSL